MEPSIEPFTQDSFNPSNSSRQAPILVFIGVGGEFWHGGRAIPVCISIVSALLLFCRVLTASPYAKRLFSRFFTVKISDDTPQLPYTNRIEVHGGRTIFLTELVRLIGCFVAFCISVARFLVAQNTVTEGFECITFTYSTVLALFIVVYPRPDSVISLHLITVLASSWMVYFVRDVIPLMMYTQYPADFPYMLWELVSALSFTAVFLPLITPRRYTPLDVSDPTPPSPEQTASPLSLLLFGFLDEMVWKAYHEPRLPLAGLPLLADSDRTKNIVHTAFPHLDPHSNSSKLGAKINAARLCRRSSQRRKILWTILFVFRKEAFIILLVLLLHTLVTLLSPYGLKRLLEYLGNGGKGAIFRPWVWVALLFLGPFTATLMLQQYQKTLTRVTVRLEAIFTQLILQHTLRMRVVAEEPSGEPSPTSASPSQAGDSGHGESISSSATTTTNPTPTPPSAASTARKSMIGRMNNLITSDIQAVVQGAEFVQVFFAGPILITLTMCFLYTILGWSALAGFGVLILQIPLPTLLTRWLQSAARELTKKRDDRVEIITEIINVIRMVKMFGWERRMSAWIDKKREVELTWVWWNKVYSLYNMCFNFLIPAVTMCSSFSVYALWMKRPLDAATVFSAIALFDILRQQTLRFFMLVPLVVKGKVSLQRIVKFLEDTELVDGFSKDNAEEIDADYSSNSAHSTEIGFRAAAFSWSNDTAAGGAAPPKHRFRLQIDDELIFKRGCVNLILGPTGSGKTSLLMALLGEMHFLPQESDSWFNLPRSGGIAYAAQETWVTNNTIRDNILFGSPYDEERYDKVVYQCALNRDLEQFNARDRTEVGERGLTLSGGQKARITLARAVYSSAEILLLDDVSVFAALDVHTAKWIIEKCFSGELVRGRTVLFVTHDINLAAPISDFAVSLGSNGRILSQGTISDALQKNPGLQLTIAKESLKEERVEEETITHYTKRQQEAGGKLVLQEEVAEGHISWASVKMYFVSLGGRRWILFWSLFTTAAFFERIIEVLQPWLLGQWATQYEEHSTDKVNVSFYLGGYVGLAFLMLFVFSCNQMTLALGALRASSSLHRRLIDTVLGTTFRWLDKTPTSRVITRATQDIAAIDMTLPDLFSHLFELGVILVVRFVAILIHAPAVGALGLVVFAAGAALGRVYMRSQLAVKREMSRVKAPVVAHFGATVEGLVSIRAYGAQEAVLIQSLSNIDDYTRCARVFNDLTRWIGIRVDALGGLFAALLGWYFVYVPNTGVSTSNSAFTLAMAVGFGRMVLIFVQAFNMFEVNGNSLERLQQYMTVEPEQEQEPSKPRSPPAHWPSSGALHVENLFARYHPDGPDVLHNLTFTLTPGERVGVVGRTGSGKSTLALALLRCVLTRGEVYLDGLQTSALDLDAFRSRVTVVPQLPELLSGSVRRNLDPFEEIDDVVLNGVLHDIGLYTGQGEDGSGKFGLDSAVARGGGNLSVGQRQIIALARAIVRDTKLLILDEATSAIDYKTDTAIQASMRNLIKKDVTVITVAHRLHTIMDYDKIMALDAGRIVEFGRPDELLRDDGKGGYLRTLVDESADRDLLYATVGVPAKTAQELKKEG